MGTITVRLNEKEEEILKQLTDYHKCGNSVIVKKALFEYYENMVDLKLIEQFEKEEANGEAEYYTYEEIMEKLKEAKK